MLRAGVCVLLAVCVLGVASLRPFMNGRPRGGMLTPPHRMRQLEARAAALNATIPPDQWSESTCQPNSASCSHLYLA
jgi:hypothetical protein